MRTWLIVLALVGVLAIGAMVVDGQGPVSKEEVQESKPLQIVGVTTGVVVMDESNNRLMAFQMQGSQLRMISSGAIYTTTKTVSKSNLGGCLGEYMSGSVDGTPRMTNPPPRRSKPISVDGVPVPIEVPVVEEE